MGSKLLVHLRRQWMGALALFLVLTGGVAYAANTVRSSDIVDGEVKTADIGDNEVRSSDVRNDGLVGGGLTGADVKEQTLNVVQGRGTLLSNRIVSVPTSTKRLLVIPGLGQLEAQCTSTQAFLGWRNTTNSTIDRWNEVNGTWFRNLNDPGTGFGLAASDQGAGGTASLGLGNDPGPRRIATIHGFAFQSQDGAPCGFQAQVELWTSG